MVSKLYRAPAVLWPNLKSQESFLSTRRGKILQGQCHRENYNFKAFERLYCFWFKQWSNVLYFSIPLPKNHKTWLMVWGILLRYGHQLVPNQGHSVQYFWCSAADTNWFPSSRAGNSLIWFSSKSLVFCPKMSEWALRSKKLAIRSKKMSDSLIRSFLVSDLSDSLTSLIWFERNERFTHIAHQKRGNERKFSILWRTKSLKKLKSARSV